MHVTLHLTTACTSRCAYCYSPPAHGSDMDRATALAAVEFAARTNPLNAGIVFFGGEPLLRRDLIADCIAHCQHISATEGCQFHYKVTTNGLLLDRAFLEDADRWRLCIGISHDGVREAHDLHRRTADGTGTFERLQPAVRLLLEHQPYATVFMTVTPETVRRYADSVQYLSGCGFRYIVASLNYAGAWTDAHAAELGRQYALLAKWYEAMTLAERKFYFSPLDTKLASHIRGADALCHKCQLGLRQISVAPDGTLYPCVQFVGDGVSNREFAIGHVRTGIDESRREALRAMSQDVEEECRHCALAGRCTNTCGCLNWQTTKSVNRVPAILCESERMVIRTADRLGRRLFRRRAPMFIQKHYNAVYPILSLMDDQENDRTG